MSSGKKGKKKKCKTVDLMSFLADGGGTPILPMKSSSWADEIEDEHGFTSRNIKEPVILPTAPRAARGPGVDEENIPTNPPYVAYISNLPYDVDEEDLVEFFTDMKVSNMRLPKDSNKLRGYGYVEFEDRQSLIDALSMTNTTIKTRRVRIEVSNSSNDDRRGGRMGRDNRRDNYDDPERTSGDWRSGPREDAMPSDGDSYRNRYDRDRRDDREASDYDNKPGGWRERDGDRGRSAFRDRGFRDDDRDREWSRYDKGSRERDSEKDRGTSFGPRRNYDEDRERKARSSTETKSEPKTRLKLQLLPRTKPIEPIVVKEEPEQDTASAPDREPAPPVSDQDAESDSALASTSTSTSATASGSASEKPSANIFGAAKPVDTTAREREIEERLTRTYAGSRSKEEGDSEKRKDGTWGRRNGEGRDEKEKEKERGRQTWRSEEDRGRRVERSAPRSQPTSARSDQSEHRDSKAPPPSRGGAPVSKGPQKANDTRGTSERERKDRDREKDESNKLPMAKVPNFVASNKYSMLPDDADPDNIDD